MGLGRTFKRLGGWFKRASKKIEINPDGSIGVRVPAPEPVKKTAAYLELRSRLAAAAGRGMGIAFTAEEVKHYSDSLP